MAIQINNWTNENRKVIAELGNFKVIEHQKDLSVSRATAASEYFSSKMNVRCRQVEISAGYQHYDGHQCQEQRRGFRASQNDGNPVCGIIEGIQCYGKEEFDC